ncbi:MAG: sensor histidine kinase [Mariprofundus sp.]|nr:sensor histidine kinase [Mariprofundus sp.]
MMVKKRNHLVDVKRPRSMWWRFLWLSLPMIVVMLLSSYLLLQSQWDAYLESVRMETAHHVESQAKNVRVEIKQAAMHVRFLAQHSEVRSVLQGDDAHALDELSHDFHAFSKYMGVYDQVRLLNRHGREVVRANLRESKRRESQMRASQMSSSDTFMTAAADLQDKSKHAYFWQTMGLPDGAVFISKFTLNIEHGQIEKPLKPVLRFAAPVFAADGEQLGIVVLNFLGKVLIDRYLDATDVRGENMLLNANSFFFHAADASSTWGSVLEEREDQNLASRFPEAWNMMVDQRDGQVLTEQGLFTFATVSPYALIGETEPRAAGAGDWIVVSYVSNDALHDGVDNVSTLFVASSVLVLALWLVLAWLWARSEMQREQLLIEKRELLRLQLGAQEEERHKLARSLHDDMGQSLTSIQAYAAAIAKDLCDEKAQAGMQHIRDITRHIQHAVRNQLLALRPASLERLGLPATLDDMLKTFAQREDMIVDFAHADDLFASVVLSDEQNIHLFRIVQEALTNVAKHSQASRVNVGLSLCDATLHLSIHDNGCGMDAVQESGLGLLGMRERTELLHGTIQIESALGAGVLIDVHIPLGQMR